LVSPVVGSGDRNMILLLLVPPAQRLRVRVVHAAGLRRRLERDGRPGWSGGVEGQRGLGLLDALDNLSNFIKIYNNNGG
jgi:hypothetical protein